MTPNTSITAATIAAIVIGLKARHILQPDGQEFTSECFAGLRPFFEGEPAATSVNYNALLQLGGDAYHGIIEISREGGIRIMRAY